MNGIACSKAHFLKENNFRIYVNLKVSLDIWRDPGL